MKLTDLRDKQVRDGNGKRVGRVHDVHADKGEIVALKCGPGSLIERMTSKSEGRTIPWSEVKSVTGREIVLK